MRVFVPKADIRNDYFYLDIGRFKFTTHDFENFAVIVSNKSIAYMDAEELRKVFNLQLVKEIVPNETNRNKVRQLNERMSRYDMPGIDDIPRQDLGKR